MKIQSSDLKEKLEKLGQIGAIKGCGVSRFTYSDLYFKGLEYMKMLMQEAGMQVQVDRVGNLIGTYLGETDKIIALGSHIDTVPNAGMFDGCLGVIGGIECVRLLHLNNVKLNHTLCVIVFAEEEGNVVKGLFGSTAFVGKTEFSETLIQKMKSANISEEDVQSSKFPALDRLKCFLELHIEQGGILDSMNYNIGVVKGIVGIERYDVSVFGKSNHAGSTPMSLRDDALVKAAELITELNQVTRNIDPDMVCTVGWIKAEPGVSNVIPGKVDMILETRSIHTESMKKIYDYIVAKFNKNDLQIKATYKQAPVLMNNTIISTIESVTESLSLKYLDMNSGAGHDTMEMADATKCGMIFVPSKNGISHSPDEWTEWTDAENGANVLLNTLLRLDTCELD